MNIKLKVLELIKMRKTASEICNTLDISSEKLYNTITELTNDGFTFNRLYYSDGSIRYVLCSTTCPSVTRNYVNRTILSNPKENTMKFLVISDIHAGNALEGFKNTERAFEYCKKNGIHIIFNCGDFVDGTYGLRKKSTVEAKKQIEHFINNYPKDNHILTFGVGGGHDFSLLNDCGMDITKVLANYRHDIIVPGYSRSFIWIKNEQILLHHTLSGDYACKSYGNYTLSLNGHLHKYATPFINEEGKVNMMVPTLCDMCKDVPSALELTVNFENGYFHDIVAKRIFFGNTDIVMNEEQIDLSWHSEMGNGYIANLANYNYNDSFDETKSEETVEEISKPKVRTLSQIEKFNRRYNKSLEENK